MVVKGAYDYDCEVASDVTEIAYENTTADSEYRAVKRDAKTRVFEGLIAADSCQGIIFHRYITEGWTLGEPIEVQKEGK